MSADTYRIFADLVLVLHAGVIAFVTLSLPAILYGGVRRWEWIRNPWFRTAHLGAIGLVVFQAWLGVDCPLTVLEMNLRAGAGGPTYGGSFIGHWLHRLLFFQAPPWVFTVCYTLFGTAVAFSWVAFRPRPFQRIRRIQ